ncbi:uroporphyrinogen-III synthase [Rhizobium sp. LjRoot254]|uniref:uroporphyrinogen-III synthase n=1 Tax=Rhizobium sp. LjRoot254 TaxID=3342297 RepID=UPI003ED138AB
MRVLITRPESRAEGTAAKLTELGHEPVSFPLFAPVRDPDAASQALATPHSAIAVTSPEAVRSLMELGDALTPHLGTKVFAVGRATARAARDVGFTDIDSGAGGGLELAHLVSAFYAGKGQPDLPVLYLAGEKRMGRFERVLADNGIACFVAETYQMEPIAYTIEEQQAMLVAKKADAVFFYSRETANAFFALEIFNVSHDAIRKTLFFCLSRNIAEAVPEELQNSAVVSDSPDEDELIDLL